MANSSSSSRSSSFVNYKCCKSKPFIHYVCVKCFNIIHKSCLPKYIKNIRIIKENKIVCCRQGEETYLSDDDEKSILEKTINEMMEDSEIKNNYIRKLKSDNKLFVDDAIKTEEDMNMQIRKHEKTIQELKEHIRELKNSIEATKKDTKTNSTQTDKNNKNASTITEQTLTHLNNKSHTNSCNERGTIIQDVSKITFKNKQPKIVYPKHINTKEKQILKDPKLNIQGISKNKIKKNKILILGDEYGSKLNMLLSKYGELDPYEIMSIIKPGALLYQIIENIDTLSRNLTLNDYIIVIAGTNDINKNNTPSFRYICKKLKLCTHTNILISSVPHKSHNKKNNILKNKHISKYNFKLNDFLNKFNKYSEGNISYLEINNFTDPLKYSKELLALNIKKTISQAKFLPKKNLIFIHATMETVSSTEASSSELVPPVLVEDQILINICDSMEHEDVPVIVDTTAVQKDSNTIKNLPLGEEIVSTLLLQNDFNEPNPCNSDRCFLYPRLSQTTFAE